MMQNSFRLIWKSRCLSSRQEKVEQVLGEVRWFSRELGEQTTKSNGVSELFMAATISRFLSFLHCWEKFLPDKLYYVLINPLECAPNFVSSFLDWNSFRNYWLTFKSYDRPAMTKEGGSSVHAQKCTVNLRRSHADWAKDEVKRPPAGR